VDHDLLIDGGTGVGDLSFAELLGIDHIFVTHAHLDHIAMIPFLVDTVGYLRKEPITLYATAEVLDSLAAHIFNWRIWPDFTVIPHAERPYLRTRTIAMGEAVTLAGRRITPLPANHVVPACGFQLDSGRASLVFSGDTTVNDALWEAVNRIENLQTLIIETAFRNRERDIAIAAKHLCPSMLAAELAKLKRPAQIYITHLKPGEGEEIMREIEREAQAYHPRLLRNGEIFTL